VNSRERVKKVLSFGIPDRIPIDLGGTPATSISPLAYYNLRKKLNIDKGMFYIPNFVFQSVYPEKEILDLFNIDIIDAGRAFIESVEWKIWKLNEGIECLIPAYINIEDNSNGDTFVKNNDGFIVAKKRKDSSYFDECSLPYKKMVSIPTEFSEVDLKKTYWHIPIIPWHLNIFDDNQFKIFVKNIKDQYERSDKAISLLVGLGLMEEGKSLRGAENFYCDIYQDKKGTGRLLDALLDNNLKKLDRILKGVGNYIDIIRFADDFGFQDGPIISIEKYREIFKPRHKKMWDLIHKHSNCSVSLHSCGSVFQFIPDFIDAGMNILNPIQISAKDMQPEKLKKEFGKDLIFWGGCGDTQVVLPRGNAKDVEKNTKKNMEALGKDGGLIFAAINNIQSDIPPENIIALFETANKYSGY
jgi:uroporphyrinogen decarboxylase